MHSQKKKNPTPNTQARHPIKPPQFARRPRLPIARRSSGTRGPFRNHSSVRKGRWAESASGFFIKAPDPPVAWEKNPWWGPVRLAVDDWSISWGFYRRSPRVFLFFSGDILKKKDKVAPNSPGHRIKTTLSEKREKKSNAQ